ncbi:UNVERIFIED_CONTAM: hypothetical protein GTU68_015712 [Idotea baltica]|nr:hypothetical protein [Idotea baltica]
MLPVEQVIVLRGWLDGFGIWAPIVFALLYAIATISLVPGLILTIAAGAILGPARGIVAVSLGSTVGSIVAFSISRHVARDRNAAIVARKPTFLAIDRAIAEGSWKIVALLRLSPAIPFNLQNYFFGLTRIRFWPYMLTSWIAMMPATVLYVYVGHMAGSAAESREKTPAEWGMLAIGLAATIAATLYVTGSTRRRSFAAVKPKPAIGSASEE